VGVAGAADAGELVDVGRPGIAEQGFCNRAPPVNRIVPS
jgi:hypothetical protein